MIRFTVLGAAVLAFLLVSGCAARPCMEKSAPFVHVVLFKTKAGTPEAAAEILKDVKEMLEPLPTVKGLWVGRPAPTNTRPIVDANYDVGLMLLFESQKGLEDYLAHPTHAEFAKKHDTTCDVRVFDFVPKA